MISSISCDWFFAEDLIQFTALTWMKTFLGLAQRSMMGFTANFLVSILPCVAYDSNKTRILNNTFTLFATCCYASKKLAKVLYPDNHYVMLRFMLSLKLISAICVTSSRVNNSDT